ncbi:MAG: hypothetical protein D6732_15825 [Methanobacteriota archaeon]|nr:MAG: hypothetical protein D6732_15825 [Euryarchaeota archaeon]
MFEGLLDRIERLFNTIEMYVAIWLIGSVIAFLYLLAGNMSRTILIAYLTVWTMVSSRILWERRYFQRYDSILASSQFVGLPYVVILLGFLVGETMEPILVERSVILINGYRLIFFHTILLGLPHLLFQSYIFWKIHRKEWLGFAVHRKLFRTRLVPFLVHSAMAMSFLYIGWKTHIIDPLALMAVAFWLYSTVKYYVLGRHILRRQSRRRQEETFRAAHSNAFLNDYLRRSPRRSRRSNGIPSRPRRTDIATIEPGREIQVRPQRRTNGNGKKTGTNLMPTGHVRKEDLACTICYEPIRPSDGKIVLCPHCKFPAHEQELKEWRRESNLCPRCSKPVSRLSTKLKLDASQYSRQVLKKLK